MRVRLSDVDWSSDHWRIEDLDDKHEPLGTVRFVRKDRMAVLVFCVVLSNGALAIGVFLLLLDNA